MAKKNDGKKTVPLAPKGPRPSAKPTGTPKSTPKSAPSGSRPGGSSNKSGSTGSGAKGYEKRQIARENEAKDKARDRYLRQAKTLGIQIDAKREGLKQLKLSRDQNLSDIGQLIDAQLGQLKEGAAKRGAGFLTAADNNAKATDSSQQQNISNLVREQSEATEQILTQGAGETDMMKALLMGARNWQANTSEANRAYFDTQASVNQGITDLNLDTQTALSNTWTQGEADKEKIWQEFRDSRSEILNEIANLEGQQAESYSYAKEMETGGDDKGGDKGGDKKVLGKKKDDGKGKGKGKKKDDGKDEPRKASALAMTTSAVPDKKKSGLPAARGRATGMAKKIPDQKVGKDSMKRSRRQMRTALEKSAEEQGESYEQKPLPDWIENYEGTAQQEASQGNSNLGAAMTMGPVGKAEGASLRRWSA